MSVFASATASLAYPRDEDVNSAYTLQRCRKITHKHGKDVAKFFVTTRLFA